MASHFDCLGFNIRNEYEYKDLIQLTASNSETLPTWAGGYMRWQFGNGIELWAQLDQRNRLVGLSPHYRGKTTQILALSEKYPDPQSALDGAFEGWVNPQVERSEEPLGVTGDYPLVFDSPAFDWFRDLTLPAVARVQLAGFAHSLEISKDDQGLAPLEFGGEAQLAERFFIPSGTFTSGESDRPEASAWFGGTVLSCERLYNMVSKDHFLLANVRTYGMDIDIVMAEELASQPLAAGQTIRGNFWLSGLILEILETFDGQNAIDRDRLFLQTRIAGLQYHDVDQLAQTLAFGDRLCLQREPENPYDPNAIAVYTPYHVKLGYIPRAENFALANIMDSGGIPVAHIVNKVMEPLIQLYIRVYLPPETSSCD